MEEPAPTIFRIEIRINRETNCDTCVREKGRAEAMSESVGTSGPEKGWFVRVDAKEERGRS
jgi:hypothetical protein